MTRVGLCVESNPWVITQLRAELPGLSVLRFGLPMGADGIEPVSICREGGYEPLVILGDTPGRHDLATDDARARYADWCASVVAERQLDMVELLNEPVTLAGWMDPARYHWTLRAAAAAIRAARPSCRIAAAGEMLIPDRKGPSPRWTGRRWEVWKTRRTWWDEAIRDLPAGLIDAAAIHPYREPASPDTVQIGRTRLDEYRWCQAQAHLSGPAVETWVTEVGWNLSRGVSEALQAQYLARELDLAQQAGVPLVVFYAAPGRRGAPQDFGLFEVTADAWLPRVAVGSVRDWIERSSV